jgi:tetratricopeptide (TPR) repeat protein
MPEKCSAKRKPQTEKEKRDLEVQISFLEGLVRRAPNYVEALQILGDHYTQHGDYSHGLRVDQQLSRLQPRNPLVFYNLACSLSLTGALDQAASALTQALHLGYRDFKWLARDPDLLQLRQHPLYRGIESQIRKMKVEIA